MITIIIPTYNEKQNINFLIKKINELKITDLNILVVDDNSPDKTSDIVKKRMKSQKNLYLLKNKNKQGLGKAYKIAMDYALENLDSEVLIEIDADLSHNPEKIKEMVKYIKKYDMVIGSRYVKGGSIPKHWEFHRKIVSRFGNLVFRVVLGFHILDWTTGYRAIRKQVYKAVRDKIDEDMFEGYTFQVGFLYYAVKQGFSVKEIPIRFRQRNKGESKFKGINYIINNLRFIAKIKIRELFRNF